MLEKERGRLAGLAKSDRAARRCCTATSSRLSIAAEPADDTGPRVPAWQQAVWPEPTK